MYDDYDYDDEDGGPASRRRLLVGAAVLGLAAAGWYFVRPALAGDEAQNLTATTDPGARGPQSLKAAAGDAPVDVLPESASTSTSTTAPQSGPPYSTMPDGTPVPVVAIFDDDRITLSGVVPNDAAVDHLVELSATTSARPDLPVDNRLTVDPQVPVGVGVRMLELNTVPFAEESATIGPEHAAQLDRLAALMNQLPHTTVVIVGHADQRGTDADNLVLSQRRAEAVVAYLVEHGIEGSRLSSRSVGEADLLTIDNDDAALALNRRTEFIIYGLLTEPAQEPAA